MHCFQRARLRCKRLLLKAGELEAMRAKGFSEESFMSGATP
jgi:hypothetical protein